MTVTVCSSRPGRRSASVGRRPCCPGPRRSGPRCRRSAGRRPWSPRRPRAGRPSRPGCPPRPRWTFAPPCSASPTETPRYGWLTLPPVMSWSATRLALLAGDGEADADVAVAEPAVAIALLMPMTSPLVLTSAPPELPGLIGGVGLDRVADRRSRRRCRQLGCCCVAADRDRAVQRADDARGHRALQAERAADGEHGVADPERVAVAELGERSAR